MADQRQPDRRRTVSPGSGLMLTRDLYDVWLLLGQGVLLEASLVEQKLALYDLVPTAATLDQALALAETDWERDLRPLLSQYVEADTALRSVGVLRELFTA
ncbi:MAG: hypothetical protein KDI07_22530 [Anaerolineae bacterium]|nr:hypothetical protein [Anaerolineae bacterium]MCB0251364.1 hypothetical protein [Anaerolineae bacterium]